MCALNQLTILILPLDHKRPCHAGPIVPRFRKLFIRVPGYPSRENCEPPPNPSKCPSVRVISCYPVDLGGVMCTYLNLQLLERLSDKLQLQIS